ncbi:MAG: GNAT family N-acetyltransferase [Pseudomonadota bacterium]
MTQGHFQSRPTTNAKSVTVTVTYLEQTNRPAFPPKPSPKGKIAILQAIEIPIHYYRYLYRLVGDSCNWVSRRRMSDQDLKDVIHHPDVEIYILYANGAPAGFGEIDRRNDAFHEIKFFGLAPEFQGRRLGGFFLSNIIDIAWAKDPQKVRLETCTLDHPAALPLYQKYGFDVYDRRDGVVELMDQPPTPN